MLVTPGEQIVSKIDKKNVSIEHGTYAVKSDNESLVSIRASRFGTLESCVKRNNASAIQEYKISQSGPQYGLPKMGQVVIGKVIHISHRIATVQLQLIIMENETHIICYDGYQGLVKAPMNIDNQSSNIPLYSCIRVSDVIRARVLAIGLYQTFYLDIQGESQLGVLRSWCPITKDPMQMIASDQSSIISHVQCPTCRHIEQRKCAITSH